MQDKTQMEGNQSWLEQDHTAISKLWESHEIATAHGIKCIQEDETDI